MHRDWCSADDKRPRLSFIANGGSTPLDAAYLTGEAPILHRMTILTRCERGPRASRIPRRLLSRRMLRTTRRRFAAARAREWCRANADSSSAAGEARQDAARCATLAPTP